MHKALPPLLTAMVTLFDPDDMYGLNEDGIVEMATHLTQHGSGGIVATGTTGESSTLTHDEKSRIYSLLVGAVGDKTIIIAGTGGNNTKEAIALSQEAARIGVDGILSVDPYYVRPSQRGLFAHHKAIAEAVGIPVIVYIIPTRTCVQLDVSTVIRLAKIPNIVGAKIAVNDVNYLTEIIRRTPDDFLIYAGDDSLLFPVLALGGHGGICVASHLVGHKMKEMIQAAKEGKIDEARAIHFKLFPLFKILMAFGNPMGIKTALNLMDMEVGGLRPPLVEATKTERAKIARELRNQGLLQR